MLTFDLQKAFDRLNHELIIKKFLDNGFPRGFVILLKDYLTGRLACVKLHKKFSHSFTITTGVPQGTVLSPYIFAAYFGDFKCQSQTATAVKFADDLTVILTMDSTDTKAILNDVEIEINNIRMWCQVNDLNLNESKSKALVCCNKQLDFSDAFPMEIVTSTSILGLTITNDLKWDSHVNGIIRKVNSRFYALRRLRPFLNPQEMHELYTGYIRSVMEYACPVFVGLNKKLASRLVSADKRAHRIIFREDGRSCNCHVEEITRRRHSISLKLYDLVENDGNHVINEIIPNRLPHRNRPVIPVCRTQKSHSSFVAFTARLLNNL